MGSTRVTVFLTLFSVLVVCVSQTPKYWDRQYAYSRYRGPEPPRLERQHPIPTLTYKSHDRCNLTAVQVLVQTTYCRPRMEYETLLSPYLHSAVYPEVVRVDRCSGGCFGMVTCYPGYTENVTVPVLLFNLVEGGTLQCAKMTVLRHKNCKCDCILQPRDCTVYQWYNKDSCGCECGKFTEKSRCLSDTRLIWEWDERKCKCECRHKLECSTSNYFDDEEYASRSSTGKIPLLSR
ncbi:uncharacterized protein LOC135377185 isoform X2 [Ornithodoros turicata]|uniref:uncharacterized protein LOC135377185 isoform X2 n=1 Tax=Ornithodoros turicata TaxID=34597 RepID=UPI003139F1D4